MEYNLENAVNYHYDQFPPKTLDYEQFLEPLIKATDAVARYDQMLKNMHNSEIFLAPLRNQEAVISSRMEGTISTMDEILKYEADHDVETPESTKVRSEVIETILYQRALKAAQKAMKEANIKKTLDCFLFMYVRLYAYSNKYCECVKLIKALYCYI